MIQGDSFKVNIPAQFRKSEDGEWLVYGRASTNKIDRQGETIVQDGMDLTPVDEGKGVLNYDHGKGPENLIGLIKGYERKEDGIYISGKLFKNHTKSKAVYEIMSSLGKSDKSPVALSVEGKIVERCAKNPKIIKKCKIGAVAVTLNPINTDTYLDLAKSMNAETALEWEATGETPVETTESSVFTPTQVFDLLTKALTAGESHTKAPKDRKGGEALAQEELCPKCKKPKQKPILKSMEKSEYQSNLEHILDNIQKLHPQHSRNYLWEALKNRLNHHFPNKEGK